MHSSRTDIPPSSFKLPYHDQKQIQLRLSKFIPLAERRFPGAQPISFLKHHLNTLLNYSFFVSEKSDGTRFLFYVFIETDHNREQRQRCILIDRKNAFYQIDMYLPDIEGSLDDTLFDGELVCDIINSKEYFRFLAFDLLMYNGELKVDKNLEKRLGALYSFVIKPYQKFIKEQIPEYRDSKPFTLEMKKVEKSYYLKEILNTISSLKHQNDGLLFTNVDAPYVFGTCESMLKWKPKHLNSVDFKREDGIPVKYILQILSEKYVDFGELVLDRNNLKLREMFFIADGKIVECSYDESLPTKWRFMRFRDDKSEPNYCTVVDNIMKSIKDSVDVEELTNNEFLRQVKENWARRMKQ